MDKDFLYPDYDDSFDVEEVDEKGKEIDSNSKNNNNMVSGTMQSFGTPSQQASPFGASPVFSNPSPTSYRWGGGVDNNKVDFSKGLGNPDNTGMGFKPSSNNIGNQKEEINRNKKVVICDFLDCVAESLSSNGVPGLLPRDMYDLKPRFEVWSKLCAFNPEGVAVLVPINLIPTTNGYRENWLLTIDYFCASLCSYLRLPFGSCSAITYDPGVSKTETLECVVNTLGMDKGDLVNIGIYSGINGQSNCDIEAATRVGVDYVDLVRLINNMI